MKHEQETRDKLGSAIQMQKGGRFYGLLATQGSSG